MCNILWNEKSVQKVHTVQKILYFYLKCLENTRLQQFLTSSCIMYNLLTSSLCTISFGMKSRYKKFTLCTKLYFYLKCLENTRLQQLLTSCCIMYNLLWKEKLAQNFTLCPKLYFPYHYLYTIIQISKCHYHCYHCQWLHFKLRFLWSWCLPQFLHKKFTLCLKLYFPYHYLYTIIQISKCQHHCYHCQWLHFKLRFLWSWCLPQFLHKKFTLCPKLYFPYHHLYTIIQNVNIIAIIASDFTLNFGFCGLGAYHSFCTKNSHCAWNFTFHIIICTQISKMSTSLLSLPMTSLQTSVSVVLVPTTVFAQKIHTVPETLLSISLFVHNYPNIQMSTSLCQWLHFKLRFLWSWCLPQFLHKKFTLCPKLYFPYHHLYTIIQNVNIIAIIASDFTLNFGFCGLGAYHSFCTKNSHCAWNFTFHIIICTQISKMSTSLLSLPMTSLQTSVSVVLVPTTVFVQKIHTVPETLLSISSFVHKYPNIQMSTSLLSLPVTSLQTSVSVVLVPTTVFALSTLYIQEAAICTWLLCTKL